MRKFTLTHTINCSVDKFWTYFFDKDFNNTLFLEQLGFPEYEVLEQTEGEAVKRRVRGRPKMTMPKPVAKLLGDSFGYEEDGHCDTGSQTWIWKMKPNTLADKLNNHGTVKVEAAGDGKCRRIAEIFCEAKVFGVGGLIEKTTEDQMRDGWDKSAAYMNEWIADHPID
jgi:Protein of unknown function (DUF2505)